MIAKSIHDRLKEDIIPTMVDNVVNYVAKSCETYNEKLTEHKKELESEYEKLLKDKDSNEQRQKNVEKLQKNIEIVENELDQIVELRGELNNYVEQ